MIKRIIFNIIFISITLLYSENYKKIRISDANEVVISKLVLLDFPQDEININKNKSIEIFVTNKQFKEINEASLNYEVLIDDWYKYFNNKKNRTIDGFNQSKINSKYHVKGFDFGSMGGFYNYKEIWKKIDEMILNYPNLISQKEKIGVSIEDHPIYSVKISDNPNIDENEPEVLYTALHYSKEPMSMMQMIYFMYYLLENYDFDNEVKYLMDNRELYFIPVVNPDGYLYNEQNYPNGGGMWRKNRRVNDDGSYGVDFNRNYGFKWGYDDSGSSGVPSSDMFRGGAAFSEPETEAIRQFCKRHIFSTAFNYHSRGNLLISPWGYMNSPTQDSAFFQEMSPCMTKYNNYLWGTFDEIIYRVNGGATDWFYGEQIEKNKILSMTVEVGNSNDGVWPNTDRIIPLAEENVFSNLYLAKLAGEFIMIENIDFNKSYYLQNDEGSISINIRNKGLKDCKNLKLVFEINNKAYLESEREYIISDIPARSSITLENIIKFKVIEYALAGDLLSFTIKQYLSDVFKKENEYSLKIGYPEIIFADSLKNVNNWAIYSNYQFDTWEWGITHNDYYSDSSSITDSPYGEYLPNALVMFTSKEKFDLGSITFPYLEFKTKYEIESGWDYGQILLSSDSINWEALGGKYAKYGSGKFQPNSEFVYDGTENNWITEKINLENFADKHVFLRYLLHTDGSQQKDGWYVDDIKIYGYSNSMPTLNISSIANSSGIILLQNYPNPFNMITTIDYNIPAVTGSKMVRVRLDIFNSNGQKVIMLVDKMQSPGSYKKTFSIDKFSSGIYYSRLQIGGTRKSIKMILLK